MDVTKKLYQIVKSRHIPVSVICTETGITPNCLYPSLKDNSKRKLRADELILVCRFLGINPLVLGDEKQTH